MSWRSRFTNLIMVKTLSHNSVLAKVCYIDYFGVTKKSESRLGSGKHSIATYAGTRHCVKCVYTGTQYTYHLSTNGHRT